MFHQALTTGDHFRKMILCKVAKGKSLQTTVNMDTLTGAPDGYHSVSRSKTELFRLFVVHLPYVDASSSLFVLSDRIVRRLPSEHF